MRNCWLAWHPQLRPGLDDVSAQPRFPRQAVADASLLTRAAAFDWLVSCTAIPICYLPKQTAWLAGPAPAHASWIAADALLEDLSESAFCLLAYCNVSPAVAGRGLQRAVPQQSSSSSQALLAVVKLQQSERGSRIMSGYAAPLGSSLLLATGALVPHRMVRLDVMHAYCMLSCALAS